MRYLVAVGEVRLILEGECKDIETCLSVLSAAYRVKKQHIGPRLVYVKEKDTFGASGGITVPVLMLEGVSSPVLTEERYAELCKD